MDDPGYAAFRTICPRTFRIEIGCQDKRYSGTGYSFARLLETNQLVLATAGHMIDLPPNEPVEWLVQQFDGEGNVERQIQFTTRESDSECTYVRNIKIDIGFVAIPPEDNSGRPFARPNEDPLPVIDHKQRVMEGTRVGWAGFAYQVEKFLGRPQLCYFEGVVSAFNSSTEDPAYVVDGHNAPGVSGGPVWHWPEGDNRIEIIGVVSRYRRDVDEFPGFCVFVPINPIIVFLKHWCHTQEIEN